MGDDAPRSSSPLASPRLASFVTHRTLASRSASFPIARRVVVASKKPSPRAPRNGHPKRPAFERASALFSSSHTCHTMKSEV
jgi:hypothetical protein